MSTSTTWVPPKTGRLANLQTFEVEAVEIPEPKNLGVFTAADKALLEKQERVIAANIGAFLLLGEALAIIKGRELQRILHAELTFNEYCSKKWGFGQAYAYRLIRGYECVKNLKDAMAPHGVTVFPTNEAQVRPLASLPPEEQVKAWSRVLEKARGNVTAALVENLAHGPATPKNGAMDSAKGSVGQAGSSAEHKKLVAIARLVEKALQVQPAKRSIKALSGILMKIQGLLIGRKS